MKILNDNNDNNKRSKLKNKLLSTKYKVAYCILGATMVLAVGVYYVSIHGHSTSKEHVEYLAEKKAYEKVGKHLTLTEYKKIQKSKKHPMVSLEPLPSSSSKSKSSEENQSSTYQSSVSSVMKEASEHPDKKVEVKTVENGKEQTKTVTMAEYAKELQSQTSSSESKGSSDANNGSSEPNNAQSDANDNSSKSEATNPSSDNQPESKAESSSSSDNVTDPKDSSSEESSNGPSEVKGRTDFSNTDSSEEKSSYAPEDNIDVNDAKKLASSSSSSSESEPSNDDPDNKANPNLEKDGKEMYDSYDDNVVNVSNENNPFAAENDKTIKKVEENVVFDGGKHLTLTQNQIISQILTQYQTWNKRVSDDAGWGKKQYPDAGYDATRELMNNIHQYLIGKGDKPQDDAGLTSNQLIQSYKASIFSGTRFDFLDPVDHGYSDVMSNFFKNHPDFTQIYAIYMSTTNKEFDQQNASMQAAITTDKGTFIAYFNFNGNSVQLLDLG